MSKRSPGEVSQDSVKLRSYLTKPRRMDEITKKFKWSISTALRRLALIPSVWRCCPQGGQTSYYVAMPQWGTVDRNYTRRRRYA